MRQVYGVPMLLETCYVLSVLPSFPAFVLKMISWNISFNIVFLKYCCTALIWVLPPLLILIQAMAANTINAEANKTVKILAKIPHTGTGLDKMVDKFLMKNVRKKPILTAYGFFQLDRSALFKLFTAIITYIMILVQFTDIENSLKAKEVQTNIN
ncbi:gustatory and pheromone receptor 39a isoform X2 [Bactrocera dorsalis]|uniref:Gustatory and pheromone receptor 39a isoform X2 n=1 Tax=Bactrocera dorsalis TaxID=27457 RepID=A0ABM3J829_BACDO|nr:gustatory and pheromone receptor 39a isoform X2 [Bactrocera dorsalis]